MSWEQAASIIATILALLSFLFTYHKFRQERQERQEDIERGRADQRDERDDIVVVVALVEDPADQDKRWWRLELSGGTARSRAFVKSIEYRPIGDPGPRERLDPTNPLRLDPTNPLGLERNRWPGAWLLAGQRAHYRFFGISSGPATEFDVFDVLVVWALTVDGPVSEDREVTVAVEPWS